MAPTKLKAREKANGGHTRAAEWQVGNGAEDSDEIPEKDETEERLEKLLFGDDAGFLEGLKPRATDQKLTVRTDLAGKDAGVGEDEDLTAIADENVGLRSMMEDGEADEFSSDSYFFSILVRILYRMTGSMGAPFLMMRIRTENRHGLTVTMIGCTSPWPPTRDYVSCGIRKQKTLSMGGSTSSDCGGSMNGFIRLRHGRGFL
jgi:hypothetical protein